MKYFSRQTLRLVFRFLMMFVFVPSIVSAESVMATQRNNVDGGKQFSQTMMPIVGNVHSTKSDLNPRSWQQSDSDPLLKRLLSKKQPTTPEMRTLFQKKPDTCSSRQLRCLPMDPPLTMLRKSQREWERERKMRERKRNGEVFMRCFTLLFLGGICGIFKDKEDKLMCWGGVFAAVMAVMIHEASGRMRDFGIYAHAETIVVSVVGVYAICAIMVLCVVMRNSLKLMKNNSDGRDKNAYSQVFLLPKWMFGIGYFLFIFILVPALYFLFVSDDLLNVLIGDMLKYK